MKFSSQASVFVKRVPDWFFLKPSKRRIVARGKSHDSFVSWLKDEKHQSVNAQKTFLVDALVGGWQSMSCPKSGSQW
jgi:hypothetical protein